MEEKSGDLQKTKSGNFVVKVREFCCKKFIFIQSEHPNFDNFLGEHAPRPPKTVLNTHKNLIVVWKSQRKVKEFHYFWGLDTLKYQHLLILQKYVSGICV